jgi:hypothetical protein
VRHRAPSGLAFGEPKDKLREAISAKHTCIAEIASSPSAPRNDNLRHGTV